jgi:hypothetical protein
MKKLIKTKNLKNSPKLPVQQKQVEIISSSIKIFNDYELEYDIDLMVELVFPDGTKELISWHEKEAWGVELRDYFEEFAIIYLGNLGNLEINVYLILFTESLEEKKHLTSSFSVSDNKIKIVDKLSGKELFSYTLPKKCFEEEYTSLKVGTFEKISNNWIFKIKEEFGFLTLITKEEIRMAKQRFKDMGKKFPENIQVADRLIENKSNKNLISRVEISL